MKKKKSKKLAPLTPKQKARAKITIPKMIKELKKGRWKSRAQAVAVGLSKARHP
jgi:hypothetical protein